MKSTRANAAAAAVKALADGARVQDVGEALSVAANRLLLNDPGRGTAHGDDRPVGTVHGPSVGVHASDAANAWRNLANASQGNLRAAILIVGAYHTGDQSHHVEGAAFDSDTKEISEQRFLDDLDEAIQSRDQKQSMAVTRALLRNATDPTKLKQLLLKYSILEDGALHAEKYYTTATAEYAIARPCFRDQHLVGLARVVASANIKVAPGYDEACELLRT